mmetsp:Transcript_56032/g.131973  ORF Transcript_56032/g.131973 Transcript_56032/m.131973 type:complete len:234 (-) Transcript_56032:144-845(-)
MTSPAVARSTSVWMVMVRVLDAEVSGFDCPMAFVSNVGNTVSKGSDPFATPSTVDTASVMAAPAIVASFVPASTTPLTDRVVDAAWSPALFVSVNCTSYDVACAVPVLVSTSVPVLCVQTPAVPSSPDVVDTVSAPVSAVCDPVSPVTVTVDPDARSQLACSVAVMVLLTPATGVLCSMLSTLNTGSTTYSAFPPVATPSTVVPGCVIAADANATDPDAAIFTVGAACAVPGF